MPIAMNDINWGGSPEAALKDLTPPTLNFKVTLTDTAHSPIEINITLYRNYKNFHLAAAFANAWNEKLMRDHAALYPQYLAVAHRNRVLFPKGEIFVANSRYINNTLLEDNGIILNGPSNFPNLEVNSGKFEY